MTIIDGDDDGGDAEGFVVIDRSEAIEAMAYYVAEALMRCPQVRMWGLGFRV